MRRASRAPGETVDRRLLVVIPALLALSAGMPVSAQGSGGIELAPAEPLASVTHPGESLMFRFEARNTEAEPVDLSFTANETTGRLSPSFRDYTFRTLAPGATTPVELWLTVPDDAPLGGYELTLGAFTPGRGYLGYYTWTLAVERVPEWRIQTAVIRGAGPGETALVEISIVNDGADDVQVAFTVEETQERLSPRLAQDRLIAPSKSAASTTVEVDLPPGDTAFYELRVSARRVDGVEQARATTFWLYPGATPADPPTPTFAPPRPEDAPSYLRAASLDAHLRVRPGESTTLRSTLESDGSFFYVNYRMHDPSATIFFTRASGTILVTSGGTPEEDDIEVAVSRAAPRGNYTLVVDYSHTSDPSVAARLEIPLEILAPAVAPPRLVPPRVDVSFTPDPLLVAPDGRAQGFIVVRNAASVQVEISFEAGRTANLRAREFDATWPADLISLAPGEHRNIAFQVGAPADGVEDEEVAVPLKLKLSWVGGDGTRATAARVRIGEPAPAPGITATLGETIAAHPVATAGALAAVGAAATIPLWRREWWRYLTILGFLPLYTRLQKRHVLDHKTRERIHQLIMDQPGIHYSALKDATGLNAGALVHHLRTLERHALVTSRREGTLRRFYPVGARLPAPPAIVFTPTQSRILELLDQRPMTQRELAETLGITQQGVSYHLKTLERKGQLMLERDGGEWRYFRVHDTDVGAAA